MKLFFSTNIAQQNALVQTITLEQTEGLAEIIYNLLKLPVPKKTVSLLEKRKRIINKIINKKISLKKRQQIFQKYYRLFIQVLLSVKLHLENIL